MTKPTLRGVLLGALLSAGLVLALLGGVAEHLGYRRVLEGQEARRAKSLASAVISLAESAADESTLARQIQALAAAADATALALLGGAPTQVLAGTQAAWTGRKPLEIPVLAGSGALAELLLASGEQHGHDALLDQRVYVYPAQASSRRILGETPRLVLVQLAAGALRRELWGRTASSACFSLFVLGVLAMIVLRVVRRHVVEPLLEMEGSVRRQASDESDVPITREFATQEFAGLGRLLDETIRKRNLAHADLQRSDAELRLLGHVTRIVDRAGDLDEALRECCAQICRFLCWPIGHVYLVDDHDPKLLHPSSIWHVSSPELASEFVEKTRSLDFHEGKELPGRVLERKEPVWVRDCWEEDWFTRSLPGSGAVRAAVGFPIFVARDVVAVLELFDLKAREQELRPVAFMHNIGLALGQVLQRRQHHELLVRRNRELVEAMQAAVSATHAKSAFLANMSHEIRTPLTAIVGYAELLPAARSDEERAEHIATIRRNGELLLRLINHILHVSKIEAGRLELEQIECFPAEILQSVLQAVAAQAREKALKLVVGYDGPVPARIVTDPTRLHQVLLNLISNAVKFTERGQVQVTAGLATAPDAPRPLLRFTVEDTGIGMRQEKLEGMFTPFAQGDMSTTRRFGGTGLGLSISKSLVELLGGELHASSEEGRGSRFSFSVETGPLTGVTMLERPIAPPASVELRTADLQQGPLDDLRILLAEDGPDNQRLITRLLGSAGAKVEVVENGALAIERALAASAAGQPFDVILMDMQMPVMDGYAATRALRQQGYRGRIIAVTANVMTGDRAKCLAAGCDDFISKPVNRASLVAGVLEHTDPV
jgi:signal transduction histidine kinase/ActR/RegA family two-component response regulator